MMDRIASQASASAHEHYMRGSALHAENRLDEAIEEYRRAIELDPSSAESHNDLAVAVREFGRLEESISLLERAIELNPNYPNAYLNLGVSYGIRGNFEKAHTCYSKALELLPDFTKAHFNLANLLLAQGEAEMAIESYQAALRTNMSYLPAEMGIGRALRQKERLEEAIATFESILSRAPNVARCHFELAITFKARGYRKLSQKSLLTALRLAPQFMTALNELSDLLRDEAEESLVSTLKDQRDSRPDLHTTIAASSALLKKRMGSKLIPIRSTVVKDDSTGDDINFLPGEAFPIESDEVASNKAAAGKTEADSNSCESEARKKKASRSDRFFHREPESRYIYCPRYRLIYAPISGAVQAPVIRMICDLLREDLPELPECDPNSPRFLLYLTSAFGIGSYESEEGEILLADPKILKFTFVENPFQRIASTYMNWFVRSADDAELKDRLNVFNQHLNRKELRQGDKPPTFRQFVEALSISRDRELPLDCRPITSTISLSDIQFLGRFETLGNDMLELRKRIGQARPYENSLEIAPSKAYSALEKGTYADTSPLDLFKLVKEKARIGLYDDELESRIAERYAQDFRSLEYDQSLSVKESL